LTVQIKNTDVYGSVQNRANHLLTGTWCFK